jgi:CDP-glucose 4,6-dehydratase
MENLVMDKIFWNGKTVLITGHTGFKGSWLTLWLKKLGSRVIGFSKDIPTTPSLFELADVANGINSIQGDIRNFNQIQQVIKNTEPEIIFHMAAQSLVRTSYENPRETYETNVMGTINLLDAIRDSKKTRVVINVTSDKCYENKELDRPYIEEDPLGGYDPYSSSKACSELVSSAFRNSYFQENNHTISLSSVRAGNVIGGGDWAKDRLIPDFIQSLEDNRTLKIRNPDAIRPWQYVLEPLSGYLQLAEKMWFNGKIFAQAWNFGPNEESKKVSWIINKISNMYGKQIDILSDKSDNLHEAKILNLDCSKSQTKLNWIPKTNIEKGLEMTVNWYKEYQKKSDMKEVSEKQIEYFNSI